MLVVLSPNLLKENNCVYCLNNVVSRIDIVYIVRNLDFSKDDCLPGVSEEVKAHMRRIRRPIVYPIQEAGSPIDAENAAAFDEQENLNRFVYLFNYLLLLCYYTLAIFFGLPALRRFDQAM